MKKILLLLVLLQWGVVAWAQPTVAGIVTKNFNEGRSKLARQSDGMLIFIAISGNNFYTRRLFPYGEPDDDYKGIRTSKVKLQHLKDCKPFAADFDRWGRLYITGSARTGNDVSPVATMVRLTKTGALDSDYHTGIIQLSIGASSKFCGAFYQQDEKVVAFGDAEIDGTSHFFLARYLYSGEPDKTFGRDGTIVDELIRGNNKVVAAAQQPDGKFLAAGCNYSNDSCNVVLARYHADGSADTSFGIKGTTITSAGSMGYLLPRSMRQLPDGRIVVAGVFAGKNGGQNIFLARYLGTGQLDTSFGEQGIVAADTFGVMPSTFISFTNKVDDMAVLPDGSILLSGYATKKSDVAISRYLLMRVDEKGIQSETYGYGSAGLKMQAAKPAHKIMSNNIIVSSRDNKVYELREEWSEKQSETLLSLSILLADLHLGIVDMPDRKQQYNIYPHPLETSAAVTFELVEPQKVTVKLCDMDEKEIAVIVNNKDFDEGENGFDLNFPVRTKAGNYLLIITTDGGYKLMVRVAKK
jgi:uncharacterized delta-60 repeat protein